MQLMATFMTVLVLGGGAEPGLTVIPEQITTPAECEALATSAASREPVLIDRQTSRPVIMRFHKCVVTNGEMELERWQDALTLAQ